jgi:hypothetical protein
METADADDHRDSSLEYQRPSTEELIRRGGSAGSPDPTRQNFEIVAADDPVTLSIGNGKSTRIENVQYVGGFFRSPAFDAATIERQVLVMASSGSARELQHCGLVTP